MMNAADATPAVATDNPAHAARLRIRSGEHRGHTAGLAPGYVQANLAILPAEYAAEFQSFCQLNPKPCPLLAASERGNPAVPALGRDLDLRTDLPGYRVFENGEEVAVTHDITDLWRDDLVAFALGCSFSFEEALIQAGVPLRHIDRGEGVPMYTTNIDTAPAGRFRGKMVVSMRPFAPPQAIRAIQVTSRFPNVHGAPVHIGLPEAIGIDDLERSEYGGDAPQMQAGELPVFWACGVTPQSVIREVRPSFSITHQPGHMLITDLKNAELAVL